MIVNNRTIAKLLINLRVYAACEAETRESCGAKDEAEEIRKLLAQADDTIAVLNAVKRARKVGDAAIKALMEAARKVLEADALPKENTFRRNMAIGDLKRGLVRAEEVLRK